MSEEQKTERTTFEPRPKGQPGSPPASKPAQEPETPKAARNPFLDEVDLFDEGG